MKRFGRLPLAHQPGEKWMYNSGSDILGILISRRDGQGAGTFLHERILRAARMKDTRSASPRQARPPRDRPTGPISRPGKTVPLRWARGGRFARSPSSSRAREARLDSR